MKKNTTPQNRTEHTKKAVLESLEKSLGVVTTACKNVGIGRTQFYTWLKEDKEFAAAVKELENVALDFAESQLFQQIKNGEVSSTIFYLKTKGKHRGYIEKIQQDFSIKAGNDLSEEEIIQQLEDLRRKTERD